MATYGSLDLCSPFDDDDDDIFNVSKRRRAGRYADIVYTNLNYITGARLHLTILFNASSKFP